MSNIDIGLKNPFRFYTDENHADYRKPWTKDKIKAFNLITPCDRLLPFQVVKYFGSDPYGIDTLWLQRASDNASIVDIAPYIDPNDYKVFTFNDAEYLVYYGNLPFLNGFKIPPGEYFCGLTVGRHGWKSEVIKAVDFDVLNQQCYTEIEYCNCTSLGGILYGNDFGYKNRVYLEAAITNPKYKTEEEGFEDGDKIFHRTFQNQTKIYSMVMALPEYMVDAFSLMQLHDVVIVRSPYKEDAIVRDFKIEPKWVSQGAYAECEMEFRELVIVKEQLCRKENLKAGYIEEFTTVVVCNIVNGDFDYAYGGMVNLSTGFTAFEKDDLVLIFDDYTRTTGGVYKVSYKNGGRDVVYTFISSLQQELTTVYCQREAQYYIRVGSPYNFWSRTPFIKSKTLLPGSTGFNRAYNIKAVIFPNTYSNLYAATLQVYQIGQPIQPLVFVKDNTQPSKLQSQALYQGHNTGFRLIGTKFKVNSKNHTLDFGLSQYV